MNEIPEAEGYRTLPQKVLEARIADMEAAIARNNTDEGVAESLRLLKAERDRRAQGA
jgi:hypothetical protein